MSVINFSVANVNASCTPTGYLYGGALSLGNYAMPISSDGSFGVTWSGTGTVDQNPSQDTTSIQGRFSSGTAAGRVEEDTKFTDSNGAQYSCVGSATWTATRAG